MFGAAPNGSSPHGSGSILGGLINLGTALVASASKATGQLGLTIGLVADVASESSSTAAMGLIRSLQALVSSVSSITLAILARAKLYDYKYFTFYRGDFKGGDRPHTMDTIMYRNDDVLEMRKGKIK